MTPPRRYLVVGVAAVGALVTSIGAAVPAIAAPAASVADCTSANTVSPASLPAPTAAIQALLDAATPVICIDGTIVLTAGLTASAEVTFFGRNGVLDGADTFPILTTVGGTGVVTVQAMRFTRGETSDSGGAIKAYQVTAIDSTFDHNHADFEGGAIAAQLVDATGSTFEDNSADRFGGGAIWGYSDVDLATSTFRRNASARDGGAVVSYGVLSADLSTFEDNTAARGGGALSADAATVTNSTFATNSATSASAIGGAISAGSVDVTNSTFVQNSSGDWAGAIFSQLAHVAQSTFLDNTAADGASVWGRGGADSTYQGNIFAGVGKQIVDYDGLAAADLGGNVFTSSAAEEINFAAAPSTIFDQTADAIFGAATLADNGGVVRTVALPAGSVAIDLVPAPSTVTTDARTWDRVGANDAGAYEFGAVDPNAPVVVPAAPTLPATGYDLGVLGALSAALLAVGALALTVVRRQRRA